MALVRLKKKDEAHELLENIKETGHVLDETTLQAMTMSYKELDNGKINRAQYLYKTRALIIIKSQ